MGDSCVSVSSPRATFPLFMFLLLSREDARAPPASAQKTLVVYATTGSDCSILDWEDFLKETLSEDGCS